MAEPTERDLTDHVRRLLEATGLVVPGETVLVAVSGGPDSVALLDVMNRLQPETRIELHAGHLDHRLRPESGADAIFVADFCAELGVPCTVAARDVEPLAAARGRGLEDASRVARYEFLATAAAEIGASSIAVAHTADDQAETVLMNLLRGSGLGGLKGMTPVADLPVAAPHGVPAPRLLRPLLGVSRADVMQHIARHGLRHITDATNSDARYLRNRVRHEILPMLEEVNPALRDALSRMAESVADDLALFEAVVDDAWCQRARHLEDAGAIAAVELDLAGWSGEPRALQRGLLRRAVEVLRGRQDLEWSHVEELREKLAGGASGGLVTLPGRLQAERYGDTLTISAALAAMPLPERHAERELALSGETRLPSGWVIAAAIGAKRADDDARPPTAWEARLDADSVGEAPAVRCRRPGDRIQPLGMGGLHKSLQDLLVDARVPRAERDSWPVVVAGETVLWVPGVRLSEQARITPTTRRVLRLSARPPARVDGTG